LFDKLDKLQKRSITLETNDQQEPSPVDLVLSDRPYSFLSVSKEINY